MHSSGYRATRVARPHARPCQTHPCLLRTAPPTAGKKNSGDPAQVAGPSISNIVSPIPRRSSASPAPSSKSALPGTSCPGSSPCQFPAAAAHHQALHLAWSQRQQHTARRILSRITCRCSLFNVHNKTELLNLLD